MQKKNIVVGANLGKQRLPAKKYRKSLQTLR